MIKGNIYRYLQIDLKKLMKNVMHTIYLTMRVILYKVLEVKFQEQINGFVKI